MRKFIISLVSTAVAVTALSVGVQAPAAATPDNYIPKSGPLFNNPYGKEAEVRRLIRNVNRSIDSVPRNGRIRISAWNVRSYHITSALLRAHRRGVSVQVVMDRINWNPNNPNIDAKRLSDGLKVGNAQRPRSRKSFLRRCYSSCRGKRGIPHSKFFLFSKLKGKKANGEKRPMKWVTMYGSYNATELGNTIQWNDLYVIKNDEARYKFFQNVFQEMARDKRRKQPYVVYDDGGPVTNMFYPYTGKGTETDPVMDTLNQVKCKGAATPNGRTRIRIAQTSMYGDRGLVLAKKLAQLRRQGCHIRLVYAMFGNKVLTILRQGKVPLTHLAYDSNYDGLYDRYVHAKSMTIVGNYAGDPKARITWNGSANWTSVALASDEVLGVVRLPGVTRKYEEWIDTLFHSRPTHWGPQHPGNRAFGRTPAGEVLTQEQYHALVEARAKERGVDPYALIKQEN